MAQPLAGSGQKAVQILNAEQSQTHELSPTSALALNLRTFF